MSRLNNITCLCSSFVLKVVLTCSAQNAISSDRGRVSLDYFKVGDMVRSRKLSYSCKPENMDVPKGTVVGLERDTDRSGFILVRLDAKHDPVRVRASTLERVTYGLAAGDWVSLKKEHKKHSPVGILHFIHRNGAVAVAFIGMDTLWRGSCTDLKKAETFCVGQFVRLKSNVYRPRFEWPRKGGAEWATGRICQILPNGCLVLKFPGILAIKINESSKFLADPAEVKVVSFKTCPDMVTKYQHLEDFHWAVRPLMIALGIFTAIKLGSVVGKRIGSSKVKKDQKLVFQEDSSQICSQKVNGKTADGFIRFSLI